MGALLSLDFDDLDAAESFLARQILQNGSLPTGEIELSAPVATKPVDMGANIMLIRHRRWAQEARRREHWRQYWAGRERQKEIARRRETGAAETKRRVPFASCTVNIRTAPLTASANKWQEIRKAVGSLREAVNIYEDWAKEEAIDA